MIDKALNKFPRSGAFLNQWLGTDLSTTGTILHKTQSCCYITVKGEYIGFYSLQNIQSLQYNFYNNLSTCLPNVFQGKLDEHRLPDIGTLLKEVSQKTYFHYQAFLQTYKTK